MPRGRPSSRMLSDSRMMSQAVQTIKTAIRMESTESTCCHPVERITRAPMTMDQIFTAPSERTPCESADATARHVCAAGAGNWSVPSTFALGTRTVIDTSPGSRTTICVDVPR